MSDKGISNDLTAIAAQLKYAEQNIDAALTFAQKLGEAKNLSDVVKIQSEFVAMQFKSYNEQAKELGEAYGKSIMSTTKMPFGTNQ
jgi:hypothetical protein